MASIQKDIIIDANPDDVWDALRDFGALHTRLVPGFVTDTRLDGDARIVTFANGTVAREILVDCDDNKRRLVYAIISERIKQHSASAQVFDEGDGAHPLRMDRRRVAERDSALHGRADGSRRAGHAESAGTQGGMTTVSRRPRRGRPFPTAPATDDLYRTLRRLPRISHDRDHSHRSASHPLAPCVRMAPRPRRPAHEEQNHDWS